MKRTAAAILAGLSLMTTAMAGDAFVTGVATHFAQNRSDEAAYFEWLAKGKINGMRDEVYWADVEKAPNEFVLDGKAKHSVEVLKKAASMGVKPIVVLGYGNRLYDGGGQPTSDEGRKAYARYAGWVAGQLGPSITLYEIWNEWNIGGGSRPGQKAGQAADYVQLVKEARKAIKAVNPNAVVVAGSLGDDLGGWPWLKKALDEGLLQYADAISAHIYNYGLPPYKGAELEYLVRLKLLNQVLLKAKGGVPTPIYVTEIGWANHNGKWHTDVQDAATSSLRVLLESRSVGFMKGIWFYEFMDGGNDPDKKEHNFGLVRRNGNEKPVACALRIASSVLDNATHLKTESRNGLRSQAYQQADGKYVTAFWASPWTKKNDSLDVQPVGQAFQLIHPSCEQGGKAIPGEKVASTSNTPVFIVTDKPLRYTLTSKPDKD